MGTDKATMGQSLEHTSDAEGTSGLSRRGIFAAIVGSMAAILMSGIRPKAADAHTDQLTKGKFNTAKAETYLWSKVKGDKATLAVSNEYSLEPGDAPSFPDGLRVFTAGTGGGAAIQAFGGPGTFSRAPNGGIGVRAIGASTGVIGESIHASSGAGVFGKGPIGVAGSSRDGTGVQGRGLRGVHGVTTKVDGVGVLAQIEEGGTALEAKGPVKFSSAGLATIAAGTNSVTITPGQYLTIDANSKILCTLQSPGGVLLNVIRNPNNTFTINLTANATADVIVAWFLIN
ncbi:MAG: hypothetical protein ACREJ6_15360 [Candidatus Methylomirabilis sp.]